eukprot:3429170-Amphidinium_carterae.1
MASERNRHIVALVVLLCDIFQRRGATLCPEVVARFKHDDNPTDGAPLILNLRTLGELSRGHDAPPHLTR